MISSDQDRADGLRLPESKTNDFFPDDFNPLAYVDLRLSEMGEVSTIAISRGEMMHLGEEYADQIDMTRLDPMDTVVLINPSEIVSHLRGLVSELCQIRTSLVTEVNQLTKTITKKAGAFLEISESSLQELDSLDEKTKSLMEQISKSAESTTRRAQRLQTLHQEREEAREAQAVIDSFNMFNLKVPQFKTPLEFTLEHIRDNAKLLNHLYQISQRLSGSAVNEGIQRVQVTYSSISCELLGKSVAAQDEEDLPTVKWVLDTLLKLGETHEQLTQHIGQARMQHFPRKKMASLGVKGSQSGRLKEKLNEALQETEQFIHRQKQMICECCAGWEEGVYRYIFKNVLAQLKDSFGRTVAETIQRNLKELSSVHAAHINNLEAGSEGTEASPILRYGLWAPFQWVDGLFAMWEAFTAFFGTIPGSMGMATSASLVEQQLTDWRSKYVLDECSAINLFFALLLEKPTHYLLQQRPDLKQVTQHIPHAHFPYLSVSFIETLKNESNLYLGASSRSPTGTSSALQKTGLWVKFPTSVTSLPPASSSSSSSSFSSAFPSSSAFSSGAISSPVVPTSTPRSQYLMSTSTPQPTPPNTKSFSSSSSSSMGSPFHTPTTSKNSSFYTSTPPRSPLAISATAPSYSGAGSSSLPMSPLRNRGQTRQSHRPSQLGAVHSSSASDGDDDDDEFSVSNAGSSGSSSSGSAKSDEFEGTGSELAADIIGLDLSNPVRVALSCIPRAIIRASVVANRERRPAALAEMFEVAVAWCVLICEDAFNEAAMSNAELRASSGLTPALSAAATPVGSDSKSASSETGKEKSSEKDKKSKDSKPSPTQPFEKPHFEDNFIDGEELRVIPLVCSVVSHLKNTWNMHVSPLLEHDVTLHRAIKRHLRMQLNVLEQLIGKQIHLFLFATLRRFVYLLKLHQKPNDYVMNEESSKSSPSSQSPSSSSSSSSSAAESLRRAVTPALRSPAGAANIDFMQPTEACRIVIEYLEGQFEKICCHVGQMNASDALAELSLAIRDAIDAHVLTITIKDAGAFRLLADITEYQHFFAKLENPIVRISFESLRELLSIYIITPDRIQSFVDGAVTEQNPKSRFLDHIKRRQDYKSNKLWKYFPKELSEK